jgi:flagellar biosynthetic protein FliQ
MGADLALNLSTDMLWTAIKLCAPILGISLAVSLFISVVQVVTQIQEMSLTFVPKVFVVALTLIVLGPWMLKTLSVYAATLFTRIPQYL